MAARFALALTAAGIGGAARAQDVPQAVSPLRVESDHNGVNLTSGKTTIEPPVLSVPGAPNLRFERVQNAAPYVLGRKQGQAGEYPTGNYTVHTGSGSSESFRCVDVADCTSVTGTGSYFRPNATFRQAGTGGTWNFTNVHVNTTGNPGTFQAYASSVSYPTGETISYAYNTATLAGEFIPGRLFYRPATVTSSLGYAISITYQGNDFNADPGAWGAPHVVTLYAVANPGVALGRLTYSGNTITDLGGRVYTCNGCSNGLGFNVETTTGSLTLPGESAPALQVTAAPSQALVASVVRDGVTYNYSYTYNGGAPYFHAPSSSYWYTRLAVTGPNGFNQVYTFAISDQRVVLTGMTDSIGRATGYQFDQAYRPVRITSPEGNYVHVLYDGFGNVVSRTTTPKPGSGQAAVTETATFPSCDTIIAPDVACFRPTSSRDALNRQTDYAYNAAGQLTEQVDPADQNGVRRRTSTIYDASYGISRRVEVRTCNDTGVTCTASAPIRTAYDYPAAATLLPSAMRQIDAATGTTLTTTYAYDPAGRPTMTDGPLPGTDDATYARYDALGRKTWEIGPAAPNGVRMATRTTYRDADDKPLYAESGTISAWDSASLTVLNRTDLSYDGRRNAIRSAVSSGGTTLSVTDKSYDDRGRLVCTAVRMNPAAFAAAPGACAHTTAGGQGPDRITLNSYDAAGQLLQETRGYLTPQQQNHATYSYSPNGQRQTVTDANGNAAYLHYEGFDRLQYWVMPSATQTGAWDWGNYEYYAYDAAGNRTYFRRRDGTVLTFQYDNLNRMTVKNVPASTTGAAAYSVHYGYDLRNTQTYARFGSPTGPGVSNAYDGFGRQTASALVMDGVTRQIGSAWDVGGRRTTVTHPDGRSFIYGYDGRGRNVGVSDGVDMATLAQPVWNDNDTLYGVWRPTGVTYATQDAIGRMDGLSHNLGGTSGDVLFSFQRNPASQITSRTRDNNAYAWTGGYNVSRGYTVNGLNQYTAAGGASFTYDGNGNLRSDGANTYSYDAENRLVAVAGAHNAALRYDPLGRLYEISGAAGITRFLYDGDALVAEYDAAGTLLDRYVHGTAAGADDPMVWLENNVRRDLHADHQGSIIAVGDAAGNPLAINTYDEWGIPGAANQGRFQYTSQAWLAELGLYHYKARLYSPTLGRFLQVDPVGYDDQVNLYAYVGNDPVNAVDPSGEACIGANGLSDYCRRSELYRRFDGRFAHQTRFFAAASMTTAMLANMSIPGVGQLATSGELRGFMSRVSSNLERMNIRVAQGLESGRITGPRLDQRMVHAEQTVVQAHLDGLRQNDGAAYSRVVSEANAMLNPTGVMGAMGNFYGSDRAYQRVLTGVRENLGRDIDFARQSDREAIGNALIAQVRRSGGCVQTGTRIPGC